MNKVVLSLQIFLNYLGNYIPDLWTQDGGCAWCDGVSLAKNKEDWPHVQLSLFVEQPTPFLSQMLEKLVALDYPKSHISLWVHNKVISSYTTLFYTCSD